jgi:hypothetical protein
MGPDIFFQSALLLNRLLSVSPFDGSRLEKISSQYTTGFLELPSILLGCALSDGMFFFAFQIKAI